MIATMQHNPADVALDLIGRDYISWSEISTYQQCPLRFFWRYVERLPEPTVAASLVFGGAIHASLEHHFRELLDGNPPPNIGSLRDVYDAACQARDDAEIVFGKDESHVSFHQLAERMLRAFQASECARAGGTIIGIEEEFRGELVPGLPDLLARVDLLVDTGTKLVIINPWRRPVAKFTASSSASIDRHVRRLVESRTRGPQDARRLRLGMALGTPSR